MGFAILVETLLFGGGESIGVPRCQTTINVGRPCTYLRYDHQLRAIAIAKLKYDYRLASPKPLSALPNARLNSPK